jgi:hypothetical protein
MAARESFFDDETDPSYLGNFWPWLLANQLASSSGKDYTLAHVGVYVGIPARNKSATGYSARRRQIARWEQTGAKVFARPLRYPKAWPAEPPKEKGVDVKLAIDMVTMAVADQYDVAILASCDTDLAPAVEAVLAVCKDRGRPTIELVAWKGRSNKIGIGGQQLTYRMIDQVLFDAIRDGTDYTADP